MQLLIYQLTLQELLPLYILKNAVENISTYFARVVSPIYSKNAVMNITLICMSCFPCIF